MSAKKTIQYTLEYSNRPRVYEWSLIQCSSPLPCDLPTPHNNLLYIGTVM